MSHSQTDRPTTFLPPDDVPTFGRPRRGGVGFTIPTGSGFLSHLMGGVRIMFLGALFKIIVPLGTIAVLFFFWPQIIGIVTGGGGTGLDRMTIVRWSWAMLKSSVIGVAGVFYV